MKIAFASDIHLEFGAQDFQLPDADVLLLAGDICVASDIKSTDTGTLKYSVVKEFFSNVSRKYKRVIYIMGNHEYYDSNMTDVESTIREFLDREGFYNVISNPFGAVKIDGVKFVYATLWTDIKNADPIVLSAGSLNDYTLISIKSDTSNSCRNLTPIDTVKINTTHRAHIEKEIDGHDKVVIVTHHAPHMMSCGSKRQSIVDFYYCNTGLEDMILDNPQIKYFIHGHTHSNSMYSIGDTQVLSNCRGYFGYENTNVFEIKVFEI
jgi:Icc-related predicted phosphoesterase